MVETLVALLILVVIGAAVTSLVLTAVSTNDAAKRKNQGSVLAEEGLEQVRAYFQTNGFLQLYNQADNKCYPDGTSLANSFAVCPADPAAIQLVSPNCLSGAATSDGSFYRSVWLTRAGSNQVKARSVVTWEDRGMCRYTEVGTYFFFY